jgi:apolipoprotein N-acyltransferase
MLTADSQAEPMPPAADRSAFETALMPETGLRQAPSATNSTQAYTPDRLDNTLKKTRSTNGFAAICVCAVAGSILGLSAPGFDQSMIAWFGLTPLLVATFSAQSQRQAFVRAFVFGACYNLVYLQFLLTLNSAWAWLSPANTGLTAAFWWLVCAIHQGVVFGIFAVIVRKIPLTCCWIPELVAKKTFAEDVHPVSNSLRSTNVLHWPIMFVVPLLWVVMLNKIGNSPLVLGIPWTMLEYSQYKNLELIQIAKFTGGIGIGALLVMVNTALFAIGISQSKSFSCTVKPFRSSFSAISSGLWIAIIVAGVIAYGSQTLHKSERTPSRSIPVSMIQGNISGKADGSKAVQIVERYLTMSAQAPRGLCVWTEWVFPMHLACGDQAVIGLSTLAKMQGQTWLVGALEKDSAGHNYNMVCALTEEGKLVEPRYRKRMLVPFLEHMPELISKTPLQNLVSTISPGEVDLQPGKHANVMKLKQASVGSLICLEVVSPELVNDSIRDGAELLADLSNTSWYHSPQVGRQMIAFSVMRAVETSRTVLFSTTIGPSAIVDPQGRLLAASNPRNATILKTNVPLNTEITPFVRWFH